MITDTKRCTMCGEEKALDEFRMQTQRNGKAYRRPYCKTCEAIEIRRQYLVGMLELTPELQEELDQITELYRLRLANGLNTFGTRKAKYGKASDEVAAQLVKLKQQSQGGDSHDGV